MRATYNHLAENYDLRQDNPATRLLRKKEEALIRRFSKGMVLDLGCGTGAHLTLVENSIGLDISEKMLKKAKSKSKPLTQGNIESLPIKPNSFDSVFCFYSTLNMVDLEKSSEQISRTLKTNGKIIISVVSVNDIDDYRSSPENKIKKFRLEGKPVNMRLFEKEEVAEAFQKLGLKLVYFNSIFRTQTPRWGNFQKYSFFEKLKLKTECVFPKKWGRIYLMVFSKI